MNCTNCGYPLSPTNASITCPRCHTSFASGPGPVVQRHPQEQGNNQAWAGARSPGSQQAFWGQAEPFLQQRPSPQPTPSSPTWATGLPQNQIIFSPVERVPFPQPGQMWQSAPTPESMPATLNYSSAPHDVPARTAGAMYSSPSTSAPSIRPQVRRASNLGFIVAGLCVFAGGLILIFVYIMALGLPSPGSTSTSSTAPTVTNNAPSTLPTSTTALSPTVIPSPTSGAFPGQQYIDNPQMASLVNTIAAQPIQATTAFKVNQKIYVTFNIHPDGKNGAVCLYWYLKNKNVTQFPFAVTSNATAGYSYAIYGGTGTAYVEIYWASTAACSDKILAQHVNFTVTH